MTNQTPITDADLQAYADGELDAERRTRVARHLETDPVAARTVEAIVAQSEALRAAARRLLDEPVPERLSLDSLFARKEVGRFERATPHAWLPIAAVLAGVFFLGAVSGWGLRPESATPEGVRPLVEEAADTYAVYEPDRLHPVEISASRREDLMTWASDRLRRPVSAPDSIGDYKLLGGRVVATSRGPAAMFMYDREGQRIVLMICPLSLHGTAPITDSTPDGLSGTSWSVQGVGYSLVGAVPAADLHRLSQIVNSQTNGKQI